MNEALKVLLKSFVVILLVGFVALKALWYIGNYKYRYAEDMKLWETLSFKEVSYILKFYTGPKLKIMGKGLYNKDHSGGSAFDKKGLYYDCNKNECDTSFYYYDGDYIYFLNANHDNHHLFANGDEEKFRVIEDNDEVLILNEKEYHTFKYEKEHHY